MCVCGGAVIHRFQTTARNEGTLGGATCSIVPPTTQTHTHAHMHEPTLHMSPWRGECSTRWQALDLRRYLCDPKQTQVGDFVCVDLQQCHHTHTQKNERCVAKHKFCVVLRSLECQ